MNRRLNMLKSILVRDRIINLDRVSNISVKTSEGMTRITFNFDFTVDVTVKDKFKKAQSYLYVDIPEEKASNFLTNIKNFDLPLIFLNGEDIQNNNILNLNKCSSVHFDDKRKNIVFNMSSGVEKDGRIVTDFKYMYFDREKDYYDTVKKVNSLFSVALI